MRGRGGGAALTASPVLVGAVTVLVTIVAVFLSYNANSGLPFVPTYDLKANLPERGPAREGLRGAHRRRARRRDLRHQAAKRRDDGTELRADHDEARQADRAAPGATRRCWSARARRVGLKYVELTPGRQGGHDLEAGSTIPVRQARTPVELDEFFSMFDAKARVGSAQLARRLRRRARRPRPGPEHGDRGVRARS